ncbi:MAG TPA: hypothetical protein VGM80_13840 [Gaiellaceae bacterium]|jgi:hypothetical protein
MTELVGKTVVIGVTCVGPGGEEVDRFQTFGTIEEVTSAWIAVRREGLTEPFGLPPAPELLEPAGAGIYTLRSTGEQIEPDYTASYTLQVADPESILTLRGVGFVPPS